MISASRTRRRRRATAIAPSRSTDMMVSAGRGRAPIPPPPVRRPRSAPRDHPRKAVVPEHETGDVVAEVLPGDLVEARVVAVEDAAGTRLLRGLREADEGPLDAGSAADVAV